MADLILEFGCESCYLHDLDCGGNCVFPLNVNLSQNSLSKLQQTPFTIKKEFFYPNKRVPDVYRYDLKFDFNICEWRLFEANKTGALVLANPWEKKNSTNNDYQKISNKREDNNILIILESPHNDEYEYPDFIPLQPANGNTGERFFTYFTKDILNYVHSESMPIPLKNYLNINFTYCICFVNPVPFQTSLHYILSKGGQKRVGVDKDIRNAIWNKLFLHCERDFIKRLESYKPFAILNSCTGELKNKGDLKSLIKNSIDNNFTCVNYVYKFNTGHPCSWYKHRHCKKW